MFRRLDRAADAARRAGLAVEFRGAIVDVASQPETGAAELFGLAAAVLIRLLAFGSVVAMGLPIGTALVGLLVGLSGVTLVGALVDIPTIAPLLAVMIGIGVGIDYALLILNRFRLERGGGRDVRDATLVAIDTTILATAVPAISPTGIDRSPITIGLARRTSG